MYGSVITTQAALNNARQSNNAINATRQKKEEGRRKKTKEKGRRKKLASGVRQPACLCCLSLLLLHHGMSDAALLTD